MPTKHAKVETRKVKCSKKSCKNILDRSVYFKGKPMCFTCKQKRRNKRRPNQLLEK